MAKAVTKRIDVAVRLPELAFRRGWKPAAFHGADCRVELSGSAGQRADLLFSVHTPTSILTAEPHDGIVTDRSVLVVATYSPNTISAWAERTVAPYTRMEWRTALEHLSTWFTKFDDEYYDERTAPRPETVIVLHSLRVGRDPASAQDVRAFEPENEAAVDSNLYASISDGTPRHRASVCTRMVTRSALGRAPDHDGIVASGPIVILDRYEPDVVTRWVSVALDRSRSDSWTSTIACLRRYFSVREE